MSIKHAKNHRMKLGRRGEKTAAGLLQLLNFTILCRNWRCRAGELDIVAFGNDELIFTEVKSMHRKNGFSPLHNLSFRQRKRNYHAAQVYMKSLDITGITGRFFLIEVTFRGIFLDNVTLHRDYLPPLPPRESL